jgi:hypothetical protein
MLMWVGFLQKKLNYHFAYLSRIPTKLHVQWSTDLYDLTWKTVSWSSWAPIVAEARTEPSTFQPVEERFTNVAILPAHMFILLIWVGFL